MRWRGLRVCGPGKIVDFVVVFGKLVYFRYALSEQRVLGRDWKGKRMALYTLIIGYGIITFPCQIFIIK